MAATVALGGLALAALMRTVGGTGLERQTDGLQWSDGASTGPMQDSCGEPADVLVPSPAKVLAARSSIAGRPSTCRCGSSDTFDPREQVLPSCLIVPLP